MINMTRRASILAILAATGTVLASGVAFGQSSFPERAIRLIVPFGAGGLNDSTARVWAEKVNRFLSGGVTIVENRPGGGGIVGALLVAKSKPDGYTLLLGSSTTHVIKPLTEKNLGYDPIKDFQAISIFAVATACIAVHPSLPVQTLAELIDYAKANAGKLTYGSAGTGSNSHLSGELFKALAGGLDIVHVSYGGAGPAVNDLIGGHVLIASPHVTGQLVNMHNQGRVRILAVAASKRLASLPNVPTGEEAGLPGFIGQTFNGIFAPRNVRQDIMDIIIAASDQALKDPDFEKLLTSSGYELVTGVSGNTAQDYVREEVSRLRKVLKMVSLDGN